MTPIDITIGATIYPPLDERDTAILAERQEAFTRNGEAGPQVGDVVSFADRPRLISHVWERYDHPTDGFEASVQISDGGSYYLGNGYVSMSGSLHPPIPAASLTDTGRIGTIPAWIFHHDWAKADNGITVPLRVRVWETTERIR